MKPRILMADLECSNLSANFGVILCAGYKWLGEKKVNIIGIDDFPSFKKDKSDDSGVAKALRDEILKADLTVCHYGDWGRFDLPFLNTRLLMAGEPPLPPTLPYCDTWKAARKYLKLHSNRLATLEEVLDLKANKTPIKQREWILAMGGDRKALKYVKDHCVADIELLEEAYLKLRPLLPNHPNFAAMDEEPEPDFDVEELTCPRCAEHGTLESRGGYWIAAGYKFRFHCKHCGSWPSSKPFSSKVVAR